MRVGNKYADEGITTIEEPKVLRLRPFAVLDRSVEGASVYRLSAERVCDCGEGVQCPNERKPIFFIPIGKRLIMLVRYTAPAERPDPLPPLARSYFDNKPKALLDVCLIAAISRPPKRNIAEEAHLSVASSRTRRCDGLKLRAIVPDHMVVDHQKST